MKFETAYGYYLAHKPERALELLELYLSQNPRTSEKDSVLFLRAKCLIKIRRFNDARELLLAMKKEFPQSLFNSFADKELENIRKFIPSAVIKKRRSSAAVSDAKKAEQTEPQSRDIQPAEGNSIPQERNTELMQRYEGLKSGFIKILSQKKDLEKIIHELKKKNSVEEQFSDSAILRETEIRRLHDERKAIEHRLREKNRQIITIISEKTKRQYLAEKLSRENAETFVRLHALESHLSDLQNLLGKIPGDYQSWSDVANECSRLRDELVAVEKHLRVTERKLIQAQETIGRYDRQISEFKTDEAAAEKKLHDTVKQLNNEKALLQHELADAITSHEREKEILIADLRNVNVLNDDVIRLSGKLQRKNEQWAKEVRWLYKVFEEEKKKRTSAESMVIDLQNQISLYQQELQKIMGETDALREERNSLEELLGEERNKRSALSTDCLPSSILMNEIISLEKQLSEERAGFERKLISAQKCRTEMMKELRCLRSLRRESAGASEDDKAERASVAQRKQNRIQTAIQVFYTFIENEYTSDGKFASAGTTFDLSESGLSFYTYKPLHEGISINIASKDLWNAQKTGMVRWCKTLNHNLYLIGVSLQLSETLAAS